jgi:hypothetical protein
MNTANPQLEGLYLAIAAVNRLLVDKGLVSREDLSGALAEAERQAMRDSKGEAVSESHQKAVVFPIRLLQLANEANAAANGASFSELAREVGRRT